MKEAWIPISISAASFFVALVALALSIANFRRQTAESYRATLYGRQIDAAISLLPFIAEFRKAASHGAFERRMGEFDALNAAADVHQAFLDALRLHSLTLPASLVSAIQQRDTLIWHLAIRSEQEMPWDVIDKLFDEILETIRDELSIDGLNRGIRKLTGVRGAVKFQRALDQIRIAQEQADDARRSWGVPLDKSRHDR